MNISPTTAAGSSGSENAASRLPMKTLGQSDFIKLLVTQLTTQDPLNPKQDTEFIAQMTQFSALEQSKSMQSDIARMREDQQILQANSLIGRAVQIQTGKDATAEGIVSAVQVEAGTPQIVVNGETYGLGQLLGITAAQP